MKKSVKHLVCAHCQKETNILSYTLKSPITNDSFFVCEDCMESDPPNPPIDPDDLYYQYIEDHYMLEKRLEEEESWLAN